MKKKRARFQKKYSAKDYPFVVNYDPEDEVYIAKSVDLKGCHSDGETPEKAANNIYEAMEGWLEIARKKKIPIPPPSKLVGESKKFLLRIDPPNAAKLELLATVKNESLNQLINQAIAAL